MMITHAANQLITIKMEMTSEVQVVFKTNLPKQFAVPETQVQLSGGSTVKDLTQVLTQLFDDESLIKGKRFNFMVDDTFMTSTLSELLTRLSKSNE